MDPLQNLGLDALRSFVVFSEQLNFTKAAEQLHISQPALYVKIHKLAHSLGVALYRRDGRGLELTEPGKLVAGFGRDMEGRASAFLDEIHGNASGHPLVLAAGEGSFLYLLGEAVRQYQRQSGPPLRLMTLNREAAVEAVLLGRANLGVAALETAPEGMDSIELTRVGQVLVMPGTHPLARRRRLQLKDLSGAQLIVPHSNRPHRIMLARALQSAGVEWKVAVEANGWELMLRFVDLKMGLAVVNECVRIPRGLVARALPELPSLPYHVFTMPGITPEDPRARLRQILIKYGSAWRKS